VPGYFFPRYVFESFCIVKWDIILVVFWNYLILIIYLHCQNINDFENKMWSTI
jgi:hypothetical protein